MWTAVDAEAEAEVEDVSSLQMNVLQLSSLVSNVLKCKFQSSLKCRLLNLNHSLALNIDPCYARI